MEAVGREEVNLQWAGGIAELLAVPCLASSRVWDTSGHTLTSIFSVKGALLCFLPRQADFLQVSSFDVEPILSGSSQPSHSVVCLPCVILCLGHIGPHTVLSPKTGRFPSGLVV